jgi:D-alanyl-D-alanine carboxypeptidase (penicillin-binding protein 5/6)
MQKNSEEKNLSRFFDQNNDGHCAIGNLPDLKKEVILANSMFQGLHGADASNGRFLPGEQVKAIDLLYGVMLPSGAECCIALADQIAGSEQNFVKDNESKGKRPWYGPYPF